MRWRSAKPAAISPGAALVRRTNATDRRSDARAKVRRRVGSPARRVVDAAHGPSGETALEQREDDIHAGPHRAHDEERAEHELDIEVGPGDQHHVADTAVAADDLGDDRAD